MDDVISRYPHTGTPFDLYVFKLQIGSPVLPRLRWPLESPRTSPDMSERKRRHSGGERSGETPAKLLVTQQGRSEFKSANSASGGAIFQGNVSAPGGSVQISMSIRLSEPAGVADAAHIGSAKHFATDARDRECLHALFVTNPLDDKANIETTRDKLLDGSCSWLPKDPLFIQWLDRVESRLLWIHGDPGKGKTMLTISLIEYFKRYSSPNTILAYFFCDGKDDRRNTAAGILRGLMYQVLCQRPSLLSYLRQEYDRQRDQLFSPPNALYALWRILQNMLQHPTDDALYLMVDALDECEVESRMALLKLMEPYINGTADGKHSTPNTNVKWLFTSRNERLIDESLTGALDISLEANSPHVTNDVKKFIAEKLQQLTFNKGYDCELQESIRSELQQKAGDTFLWASLACSELEKAESIWAEEVLATLPPGLDSLYRRILEQILNNKHQGSQQIVKDILCSVIATFRPLTLQELAVMADLPMKHRNHPEYLLEYVSQCGSFLTIRHETVNFVHQSAKDYLLSDEASLHFSPDLAKENMALAGRCVRYICGGVFNARAIQLASECDEEIVVATSEGEGPNRDIGETNPDQGPYLEYPINFWLDHAKLASTEIVDVFNGEPEFFQLKSGLRDAWFHLYWGSLRSWRRTPKRFTPLHLAAYSGFLPLAIKVLESNKTQADAKDDYGRTPLSWAAENGHDVLVQYLLGTGRVDVDAEDWYGWTPLWWAVMNGQGAVVQQLATTGGANVDAVDEFKRTPLVWALENGQENVIKHLVARGQTYTYATDGHGQTVLSWAAKNGKEEIVQLLLPSAGANINDKDKEGLTPLGWAIQNGHKAVLRQLVAMAGANVNTTDSQGRTVLIWAAVNGDEVTTKLLLASGQVNINATDSEGRTSLLWAARNGHKAVARQLASMSGIETNATDEQGRTALIWAAVNGDEVTTKLLLASGQVNINATDSEGRTSLLWAARNGHKAVARQLASMSGIETNATDEQGRTALIWAAVNGDDVTVKLLLASERVNINAIDPEGRTSLWWAVWCGHNAVMQRLVTTGRAKLGATDGASEVELLMAAMRGHDIIQFLASAHVNVNTRNAIGLTPLLLAVEHKREAAVLQLVTMDETDVDATDMGGQTALMRAARSGNEVIVHLLLASGRSNINAQDSFNRKPLWHAIKGYSDTWGHQSLVGRYEQIVRLLLENGADPSERELLQAAPNPHSNREIFQQVLKLAVGVHRRVLRYPMEESEGEGE
ncbi:hypothetical protein FGG08_000535 [Glutinoglossum americanum]|uniref:NACHT domain-containing protein n=1 Tax=Glutinoglossum americanum TaxID=1670608 RepID=A0A9P8I8Y5_9PEZI|nr:hypothetical protein FGG08_000535 [Glutinoglossum americanum]